jgi:hypothetical protein
MLNTIKAAICAIRPLFVQDNNYSRNEELRTFFNAEYKGCGDQAFEYWMQTGKMNFSC